MQPAWTYRMRSHRRHAYEVTLVDGLLDRSFRELARRLQGRTGLLVTTPTVARLYGRALSERLISRGLHFPLLVLEAGEANKGLAQVERVCAEAIENGLGRRSLLIGMGGGVCTDIVSFAASWIRRGIGTARIPTTLVGQIDAAIGVKGGVNFRNKKSALGCFHPPEWVVVDPEFLSTLPPEELRAGFAEIVKIAIVRDPALFELVEEYGVELIRTHLQAPRAIRDEVLRRAIEGMLEELRPNLFEDQGYQRWVDFGHVFSPLLEARSSYEVSHGKAVAVDIALTACVATRMGFLAAAERDRMLGLLTRLGLPTSSELLTDDLLERALHESVKHRGGKVNLVVPEAVGSARFLTELSELPSELVREARRDLVRGSVVTLSAPTDRGCLVYDIGGTSIRVGVYRGVDRSLSEVEVVPTPSLWSDSREPQEHLYAQLLETLLEVGTRALHGAAPERVGVAFPGPVDRHGRALAAPTLWGPMPLAPLDLAADLRRWWPSARIRVLNDVTAAGYRYLRGLDEDFCIVTVSSGIGNKVFVNGAPMTGPHGRGGELGHVRVDADRQDAVCECGCEGHVGAISSGRGTLLHAIRRAAAAPRDFEASLLRTVVCGDPSGLTNEAIAAAFRAGDPWTMDLIHETSAPLGRALAVIHAALGIERFVIVGGFARALGPQYRCELTRHASSAVWSIGQEWGSMIELGADDDLSGLLGAGRFVSEFAKPERNG
jgi:2-epi-5-epi-valiolone synthase